MPRRSPVPFLLASLAHLPPHSRVSRDYKRLTTVGVYMGRIENTTRDLLSSAHPDQEKWHPMPATTLYKIYNDILKPRQIPKRKMIDALTVGTFRDADVLYTLMEERFEVDHPRMQEGSRASKALAQLAGRKDDILFVTTEGHVGVTHHPDCAHGVRPGDIVVGLFGISYPFILRSVSGSHKNTPAYRMINGAYMAEHQWGHDFVQEAVKQVLSGAKPPRWSEFHKFGIKEYTII